MCYNKYKYTTNTNAEQTTSRHSPCSMADRQEWNYIALARSEHQFQLCPTPINKLQYLNWSCNYWQDLCPILINKLQYLNWSCNCRPPAYLQPLFKCWETYVLYISYIALQSLSINCKSALKWQTPPGHTSASPISCKQELTWPASWLRLGVAETGDRWTPWERQSRNGTGP